MVGEVMYRAAPVIWVPLIVAANILVFLAFGLQGNGWGAADADALIRWGSNFGPQTLDGEPWRLASAMFLHGGAVHLIVNMITLVDLGRIGERFFGRSRFPVLYLLSGLAGSVASVCWNPMVNSVGASGAICGILGAMLVYMLDARNRVPVAMLKSHATGIVIFLVYSVVMGVGDAPIDHAAHAGGLAGGAICALFLSPWWRPGQAFAASAVMLVALGGLLRAVPAAPPHLLEARKAAISFKEDTGWFVKQEAELLALAQQLVPKWGQEETRPQLRALAARWDEVYARFTAYELDPATPQGRTQRLLLDYIDLRRRSYRALADLPPQQAREEFERLSLEMRQKVDDINQLSRPPRNTP